MEVLSEALSRHPLVHCFGCPYCGKMNQAHKREVMTRGKDTANTYCSYCGSDVTLVNTGLERSYSSCCSYCGADNTYTNKELRDLGHGFVKATCQSCNEVYRFEKGQARVVYQYPPSNTCLGHKAREHTAKESDLISEGDIRMKVVEMEEQCDCSECGTLSSRSSLPESEGGSEPKTLEKWRDVLGKDTVDPNDIFDLFKDLPPERLMAQRPIEGSSDLIAMMMYHLDSVFSAAGSLNSDI